MKTFFCKDGYVIAQHDAGVVVADDAYPGATPVLVPDDYQPVYEAGPPPMTGMPDMRRILAPVFNLDFEKEQAQLKVKSSLDALSNSLTQYNPTAEVLSWPAKETAARQYLKDQEDGKDENNLTDTQETLLKAELSSSNSTDMNGLCQAIIAKALVFAQVAGTIAGLRTSLQTAITGATDQKSLLAVLSDFDAKIKQLTVQIFGAPPAPAAPTGPAAGSADAPTS